MLQLAQPQDRERVNELAFQIHELRAGWRPDQFVQTRELYSIDRFTEVVNGRQLYVAKVDSITLGYVLLEMENLAKPGEVPCKSMTVSELCVQKELRCQGFGTQIMAEVQALARAFRCKELKLGVYPHNDEAVAFFQKCGFTIHTISMQKKV